MSFPMCARINTVRDVVKQIESTKVQNPRRMCGLASDDITTIAHDDSVVQLYSTVKMMLSYMHCQAIS